MKIKNYQVSLLVIFCILLNYILKYVAEFLQIPLWLDSLGTAIAAYILGPVCGAIVGAAVNIMYGFLNPVSFFYAITSIVVGVTIGVCAKKGMLENIFDTMTTATIVTVLATVISTTINCLFYEGGTGNLWGDSIFALLKEWRIPWAISALVAEFFLDFLDKTIILVVLYCLVHLHYKNGKHKKIHEKSEETAEQVQKAGSRILSLILSGIILFSIIPQTAQAAETGDTADYSQYIQTIYSNNNGLLSGEANDVETTDDGIIWIGTYAGLYRYSGNRFVYMNSFDTVKNVNCLYVDNEGRLWIGTNDDGLSISINEEITMTFSESTGFPSNSVRSIIQSNDGNYYVGTSGDLAVVSLNGGANVVATYPEIRYASDLTADSYDHVVAVNSNGNLFYIGQEGILQKLEETRYGKFTCCEFRENNDLYVGTGKGNILIYKIDEKNVFHLMDVIRTKVYTEINSLELLENGNMFVCADNGTGWLNSQDELIPINCGTFGSIDHMIEDYQGNLWFSSSRQGVMKISKSSFMEIYPEVSLDEKVVNAITEWEGCIYCGTDSGIDIIQKDTNEVVYNHVSELVGNARTRCLMVDSSNRLWLCSYGIGIICCEPNGHTSVYTQERGNATARFRSCIEKRDGTIVASSDMGVAFISDGKITSKIGAEEGLSNELVLCLLETNDGKILAGTDGGGIAVIENDKVIKTLNRNDGLGSAVILRMVQDKGTDNVFIVTSNGICYMDSELNVRELKKFPYSNNYDIYDAGDGKIYVTGSAGIYIVDKGQLLGDGELSYENLNYLNGLRGTFTANSWNYVDKTDMFWYIAGTSGVTKYDMKKGGKKATTSYRMLIDSVYIDNVRHKLSGNKTITIPRGALNILIEPEIINYSATEPYVCYYLDGANDSERVTVLQSELESILFTNLNAGKTKFHLTILDGPNGKVTEEQVYTIIKEVELYDLLWFRVYFFAELILIVAWFTWFATKKASARTLELQRREISLAKEQIRMGNETILAIARTVDAKDANTSHHSVRVAEYSVMIAQRLGYSDEELENLRKIALLHDIGKIGIPDSVLNKPGRLTDEEYAIMKSHVTRGAEILKDFTLIPFVQEGALYHHERFDGKGYASGLKGTEIPETARIIGVADAFDAMTANRVYRKRLSFETVLDEMRKGSGSQFDPKIVNILFELIDEGKISEQKLYGEEEQA